MSTDGDVDGLFAALADATRRDVIRKLSEGPATATQLSAQVPVSRQAVRKHLEILDQAGLVRVQRSGREMRYELAPAGFETAMSWMAEVGARWDRRLEALQRFLAR